MIIQNLDILLVEDIVVVGLALDLDICVLEAADLEAQTDIAVVIVIDVELDLDRREVGLDIIAHDDIITITEEHDAHIVDLGLGIDQDLKEEKQARQRRHVLLHRLHPAHLLIKVKQEDLKVEIKVKVLKSKLLHRHKIPKLL